MSLDGTREDSATAQMLRGRVSGLNSGQSQAQEAMSDILALKVSREVLGAFLTSFTYREPSAVELVGFIKAFRAQTPALPGVEGVIDVCGTGGDGLCTFNVSTAVALLLAAAGVKVAKHGNRAVSSRCGSTDVLEMLGAPRSCSSEDITGCLRNGLPAFLFAPDFYPQLASLAEIRRNLGFKTVFNLLGPLLNPLRPRRQLMGVYSKTLLRPTIEAMQALGSERAMIVCGDDGMDEISISGLTQIATLNKGQIEMRALHPADFGLQAAPLESVRGGDVQTNSGLIKGVLTGEIKGAPRDLVLINAAAGLLVAGKTENMVDAVAGLEETIDNGTAARLLCRLKERSA